MSHSKAAQGSKDLYKILEVSQTATSHEIKSAYRKLAMALHPDRNDGCDIKSNQFKDLNEAYDTLSNHRKRTEYDNTLNGHFTSTTTNNNAKNRRRPPPPNYRKVYAPRPPPGFKVFNYEKHYEMHYGEGFMKEEIDRARKKAMEASDRLNSYNYESPLGDGFTFSGAPKDGNPYSKRPQGKKKNENQGITIEYEESHFYDIDGSELGGVGSAKRVIRAKETVKDRMAERRKDRVRKDGGARGGSSRNGNNRRGRERRQLHQQQRYQEEEGCVVM